MPLQANYNFEQSSGDLLDQSGNGNDSSSVTVTSRTATGVLGGNAYDFDGADDWVNLGNVLEITGSDFSASCWLYVDSWVDNDAVWEVVNGGSVQAWCRLKTAGGNHIETGFYDASGPIVDSDPGLSTGEWIHVASVLRDSDGSAEIYINGVQEARTSGSWNTRSGSQWTLAVGDLHDSPWYADIKLSQFWIYDHALTPQEVSYLYNTTQYGDHFTQTKVV